MQLNKKGGVTVRVLVTLELYEGAEIDAEEIRAEVAQAVLNDGCLVGWTDNDIAVHGVVGTGTYFGRETFILKEAEK